MAESPKRPADVLRADASHFVKPGHPSVLTGETARASDSIPMAGGPFAELPMQFGRYRIDKLLGKGMMGAVYLAHDTQLDRPVALKVARVSSSGSAKAIQRMETEAKAAAKIDHPLICKVYDFGEIDGIRFIALQYIQGEDLKSYLKRVGRKRTPAEAIKLTLQIAGALNAAHEKGVMHRDLKTENIMLNRKGEPVIMDFGLARRMTGATNAGLTQGMIVGTAAYMSPEQAIGKAEGIDHRSDLYALGVMLFEMLTGEWPFNGAAIEVMGRKCVQDAPSPLSVNPDLPPRLAEVSHKLIAQKKEDRYANCEELIAALETVDLNPRSAVEADVVFEEVPSPEVISDEPSFEFIDGQPVIVTDIKPRLMPEKSVPRQKSPSRIMVLITKWWTDQPLAMRLTLAGCSGTCIAFLAAILFFRSGDALVKIEVHTDNVEVTFQKDTFTLADGTQEFKVKPGDQTLHIKSGNVEFDTDKFTLKKGTNPAVTVEVVKSEIVTRMGDHEIGRRSLTVSSTSQANPEPKAAFDVPRVDAEPEDMDMSASNVVADRVTTTLPLSMPDEPKNGNEFLSKQMESATESDSTVPMLTSAPAADTAPTTWQSVFNGKDLNGWTPMLTTGKDNEIQTPGTGGWIVSKGELICTSNTPGWLRLDKTYGDCEIEFDFFLPPNANSGLLVRYPGQGKIIPANICEIQLENAPKETELIRQCGAIYGIVPVSRKAFRPNSWNDMSVTLQDGRILVRLNKQLLVDVKMAEYGVLNELPRTGHFGLFNWSGPTGRANGCKFRNIRIRAVVSGKSVVDAERPDVDPLPANSVWAGTRSYRKGGYTGVTVTYSLQVRERNGERFTGHKFDNGTGRNRVEVEGELKGKSISWRERNISDPGTVLTMQGTLENDSIHVKFSGRYSNGSTTEGDGELKRVVN